MRLRPLTSVDAVFITASMTRPDQATTGADLAVLHRNQGYSKIACHYAIGRDGTLHEGRPRTEPGVLAGRHNTHTYQVCLLGGVDDSMNPADNFTPAQRTTLARLREDLGLSALFARDYPAPKE